MSNFTTTKVNIDGEQVITLFDRNSTPIDRYKSAYDKKINHILDLWQRDFQPTDITPGGKVNIATFNAALSQYLSRTDPVLLEPAAGSFTIMARVKLVSKPVGAMMIASKSNATGNQREYFLDWVGSATDRFAFGISKTGAGFAGAGVGNIVQADAFGAPNIGDFNIVVGTYDQTTQKIYVNNTTNVNSGAFAGPIFASTTDFVVGSINMGAANYMDGTISPLAYWSRVLTDPEINDLVNRPNYASLTSGLKTGLVSWWDLTEAASSTRLDATTNHLDLTDHNGVGGP